MKKLRFLAFFIAAAAVLFTYTISACYAEESKKAIHIVYDDTTGIYYDDEGEFTDKWSQLKNAVQSFVALANEGDKIVIYPISSHGDGIVFERGANASELIYEMDNSLKGHSMSRNFATVTAAWEDLKEESGDYEKWLILICDGKFEEYKGDDSDTSIQEKLVSYASDGIKVVSQAISNDGAIYNPKNDENFYCYNASGAKEILAKTIEISNLIYQRTTLTEEYYEYENRIGALTIKDMGIPISELIFLVNDSRGSISGYLGDTGISEVVYLKNPSGRLNSDTDGGKLKVASGLEKNIYRYKFKNVLNPGEYKISMIGSENVTILCKADIKVELRLTKSGSEIEDKRSISTGKYDYKVVAVNPSTGEIVKSPMLDGAVYSIRTEDYKKNITNLDKKEGEISFLKGNTEVETSIELGTQKFSVSEVFYVFGEVDFGVSETGAYKVNELFGAKPFKVTVRTESLPENVLLHCSSDKNVKFRVEDAGKDNEFLVYPEHFNDNSYLFTATGKINVVFTVSVNENGEVLTFSKPGTIIIEDVKTGKRVLDWLWYYKWFFVGGIIFIILFISCFNVYARKAEYKEIEDTQNFEDESENEEEI